MDTLSPASVNVLVHVADKSLMHICDFISKALATGISRLARHDRPELIGRKMRHD
jgi:hypothetical protein